MEVVGTLMMLAYIAITIFMVSLAVRFVKATEKISNAIEKISEKNDNKQFS